MATVTQIKQWKDIVGYEGKYLVSADGDIMALNYKREGLSKRRKLTRDKDGYLMVHLSKSGVKESFKVHRLVAQHFIPNPDDKPCVNHKDFDRANNRADNLEWVTHSENNLHSYRIGKRRTTGFLSNDQRGEGNHGSKLKEADVLFIRANIGNYTLVELAGLFGVCFQAISDIKLRKSWGWLQ